jgi:hypothetical protein
MPSAYAAAHRDASAPAPWPHHHREGRSPAIPALDVQKTPRPRSAPKPASVTAYSHSFSAIQVAVTLLQPLAMFRNAPRD